MYKLFITVALLVSSLTYANDSFPIKEEKNCAYAAVGGLIPTFTMGGRSYVTDKTFIDCSGSFSTIILVNQFDLTLRGLTKYNDNRYVGVGIEGALAFDNYNALAGLSTIVTHGWDNEKTFTEVSLAFPMYKIQDITYVPHLIIKYGWKL